MNDRIGVSGLLKSAPIVLALIIALSAGWCFIAWQVRTRTRQAFESSRSTATSIWGSSVVQESPQITVAGDPERGLLLSGATGLVEIDMDYRKRGLIYLTGFQARFNMTYLFTNDSGTASPVQFYFPLPSSGELFEDLVLREGDREAGNTVYTPEGILWQETMAAGSAKELSVSYRIRGMDNYFYRLPRGQMLDEFELTATVATSRDIDYPTSTMSPTSTVKGDGKTTLEWKFADVISDFDIGMILPEHPDYSRDLVRLNVVAPALLLGLFGLFLSIMYLQNKQADGASLCLMGLAFFAVFPLSAYLLTFLALPTAYLMAATSGGVLIAAFTFRRYRNRAVTMGTVLALLLFLGLFPIAVMAEKFTGLIMTIGLFVLVLVLMELYLSYRRRTEADHQGCGTPAQESWR